MLTSCKKSATPFLSGHLKPHSSKNSKMFSLGPWYTTWPSDNKTTSSKRSKVSGAGCKRDIKMVASITWQNCCKHATIWNVVELSRPVEISSMNNAFVGPTIISPATNIFILTHLETQYHSKANDYIYIYIYNQLIPWIWIFFKSYFKIILIISYYSIWKNCRFLGWIGNTTSLRAVSLYQWWDVFSGLLKFLCAYHLPPTYLHRYQVQGSFKSLTHTQKQKLFCQGAACFNNWKAWKTIED